MLSRNRFCVHPLLQKTWRYNQRTPPSPPTIVTSRTFVSRKKSGQSLPRLRWWPKLLLDCLECCRKSSALFGPLSMTYSSANHQEYRSQLICTIEYRELSVVYIQSRTGKSILKELYAKKNNRFLTFSPACVSIEKTGGQSFSCSALTISRAEHQWTEKLLSRNFQFFFYFTIVGNAHWINHIANFLTNIRAIFTILSKNNIRLVILAYLERTNKNLKFQPI